MRRRAASIAIVAVALAACASPSPGTSAHAVAQTWLAVRGPQDWTPPEPMSLEVGDAAWSITPLGGGGVVTPDIAGVSEARLVGLETCHQYAAFEITPGSAQIIRFAADGSVRVEDAGEGREMGPGLVEGVWSDCEPPA